MTLPDADWLDREGLRELCTALGAGDGAVRYVGGAVRDTLLGIAVADVDLATTLAPDEVMDRLRAARIKAVPTGIAHGTITAVLPDGPIEVTTLRCDIATDGRHATIAYTDDWREDAARRDFTINALYADPITRELFDYFGGLDDLAARRVRFIGDPLQRIAEDHLRILRFFRFHARFGDAIDAAGLDACEVRANDLMALSRERIAMELLKLLVAPHAVPVVRLMVEHGICAPVLPEISDLARFEQTVRREEMAGVTPSSLARLAALVPAPAIDEVGARLKLSNADRRRLSVAVQPLATTDAHVMRYRTGETGACDQLLLSSLPDEQAVTLLREVRGWTPPTFPLSGGALVERGVRRGPDVARLLRAVEDQWIAEGFPDPGRVDALADAAVDQWRRASSIA